jgi:hypothetical protein
MATDRSVRRQGDIRNFVTDYFFDCSDLSRCRRKSRMNDYVRLSVQIRGASFSRPTAPMEGNAFLIFFRLIREHGLSKVLSSERRDGACTITASSLVVANWRRRALETGYRICLPDSLPHIARDRLVPDNQKHSNDTQECQILRLPSDAKSAVHHHCQQQDPNTVATNPFKIDGFNQTRLVELCLRSLENCRMLDLIYVFCHRWQQVAVTTLRSESRDVSVLHNRPGWAR